MEVLKESRKISIGLYLSKKDAIWNININNKEKANARTIELILYE